MNKDIEDLFKDYKVHHKDLDVCFNDAVALTHLNQAIHKYYTDKFNEAIGNDRPETSTIYSSRKLRELNGLTAQNQLRKQARLKWEEK